MENWNMSQHRKGNTFIEKKITFPFSIRTCKIDIQFKTSSSGSILAEWNTLNNTLYRQSDNVIIMKSRILDLPLGTYEADVDLTFEDGNFQTFFTATLQII